MKYGRESMVCYRRAGLREDILKLDGSAEKALQQINEKNYSLPFAVDGRKIIKIGVNFSTESRTIDDWTVEYE